MAAIQGSGAMTDPVPSKDLLPCPFCGKAAKVYGVNLVGCVDTVGCGAQVDWGHFYGPDPVIAAWNKRAAPEPKSDRCNALWLGCQLPPGHDGNHRCGAAVWSSSQPPRDGQ